MRQARWLSFSTWRCLACGHWDGYDRFRPGRYCFFTAVFKGKAARPVPIAEAQKVCQKEFNTDSCQ